MRPFDVLYAANAPQVDATKVLNFINTTLVTAQSGVSLVNNIRFPGATTSTTTITTSGP
jgi:polysaccharide export outer membrane protein